MLFQFDSGVCPKETPFLCSNPQVTPKLQDYFSLHLSIFVYFVNYIFSRKSSKEWKQFYGHVEQQQSFSFYQLVFTVNLISLLNFCSYTQMYSVYGKFIQHLFFVRKHIIYVAFTPTASVESPITQMCMSLDCGRMLEYTEGRKGPHLPGGSKQPSFLL